MGRAEGRWHSRRGRLRASRPEVVADRAPLHGQAAALAPLGLDGARSAPHVGMEERPPAGITAPGVAPFGRQISPEPYRPRHAIAIRRGRSVTSSADREPIPQVLDSTATLSSSSG